MSPWWQHVHYNIEYSFKCKMIVQVLIGNDRRIKQLCSQCDLHESITIEHVLFDCRAPALVEIRSNLWKKVENCEMPALIRDLNCMSSKERAQLILNGFNVKYVKEWKSLYCNVADFIHTLCMESENLNK